jgi:methylenetetrahydrofolate reductase (NADPH)
MIGQQPIFIDITWGAGASTKELTMSICEYAQLYLGVDTIMHLTLTGMTEIELKSILVNYFIIVFMQYNFIAFY